MKKDLIKLGTDGCIIIDSKVIEYLAANFTNAELGRILQMADMVSGSYNILADENNDPHTKETLMNELDYARNNFAIFMKKLYDKSIICYTKSTKKNKQITHVMLNPTLARKSKTVHKECLALFDDLRRS